MDFEEYHSLILNLVEGLTHDLVRRVDESKMGTLGSIMAVNCLLEASMKAMVLSCPAELREESIAFIERTSSWIQELAIDLKKKLQEKND